MDGGALSRIARGLARSPRGLVRATSVAATLLVGLLDYLTGPELASLLFYLVPVGIAGVAGRRGDALAVGVLAGLCWFAAEALRGREYDLEWILFWNALSRMVVFCVIGALLATVQGAAVQTRRGPRCAYCGSNNTVALQRNLVCLSCRRVLSEGEAEPTA